MRFWKNLVLFYLGGCAYVALELLWRGRSHGSMFAAGGACFLLVGRQGTARPRGSFALGTLKGAMTITAVELATGLLVNRDHKIWDYSRNRGNFLGQVCPLFTLLWVPVSAAAMVLYRLMDRWVTAAASPGFCRSAPGRAAAAAKPSHKTTTPASPASPERPCG